MGIEYMLGKTLSGTCQELSCGEDAGAIVKSMSIHDSGDCIHFEIKTGKDCTFGSYWSTNNLRCFKELRGYERLKDIPAEDVRKLAVRMYELLYMGDNGINAPKVSIKNARFRQILEELVALKESQKTFVESGSIIFF